MNTKIIALIFFAAATGMFALARTNVPPSDLRDAVSDRNFDIAIPVIDKNNGDLPAPKAGAAVPADMDFLYVREYTYRASETDNKATARTAALAEIKRQLLEELGTYVRSETVINDNALVSDSIVSMAGGLIETKILIEKWTGETFYLMARMKVDPETLKMIKEAAAKPAPQAAASADSDPIRKFLGKRVINSDYRAGTVKEVFSNGSALVKFDIYLDPMIVNTKNLALKLSCYDKVCEKNRVVHSTFNNVGTVLEVFDNGVARVKFDKYIESQSVHISNLAISH